VSAWAAGRGAAHAPTAGRNGMPAPRRARAGRRCWREERPAADAGARHRAGGAGGGGMARSMRHTAPSAPRGSVSGSISGSGTCSHAHDTRIPSLPARPPPQGRRSVTAAAHSVLHKPHMLAMQPSEGTTATPAVLRLWHGLAWRT
jgi:hypothetical protein